MSDKRFSPAKILYHIDSVAEFFETGNTYPVMMGVGLCNYCNHRCEKCFHSNYTYESNSVYIDKDVLLKFLSEAKELGVKSVLLGGAGEPTIHPDAPEILYKIKELGLEIGILSNAQKMSEELCKAIAETATWIRISIDAATDETHKIQRGKVADFTKTVENIKKLMRAKAGKTFPTVGVQFTVMKNNINEMIPFAKIMTDLKLDYVEYKPIIKGINVEKEQTDGLTVDKVLDKLREVKKYETENTTIHSREKFFYEAWDDKNEYTKQYSVCVGHYFSAGVIGDGNMYICGDMIGEEEFCIGNIYESTLKEIWHSEKRKKAMKAISLHGKCPQRCCLDNINNLMWEMRHPDDEDHPNFI